MNRARAPERTLVLVKHAMPVVDPRVPPARWRLSEEGRRQSVALAVRLEGYGLEFVASGAEPKAAETAEILAEHLGARRAVVPGLHEHDRTGAPFGTQEEFELAARRFFENPADLVWGNETAEQTRDRFAAAVHAVLEERPEGNLVIVAHGTVNTLFLTRYGEIDAHEFWSGLGLPSFCVLSLPGFGLRGVVRDIHAQPEGRY